MKTRHAAWTCLSVGAVALACMAALGTQESRAQTAAAVAAAAGSTPTAPKSLDKSWWNPGDGREMPAYLSIRNGNGALGIINAKGAMSTKGHPFFEPIGPNGRACVTCHQPGDAFSLTPDTAQKRWEETKGKDPLFAAVDGSNCPSADQTKKESHSLLLEHGLIRIAHDWPPKRQFDAFSPKEPEFTIEVVSDPSGCNSDPTYGINGKAKKVSVFRRPRPTTNLRYVTDPSYDLSGRFNNKTGLPLANDPNTGKHVGLPIMSDGRAFTLEGQMDDAMTIHMGGNKDKGTMLTETQIKQIKEYEENIYVAQDVHKLGGVLVEEGGPKALGPKALQDGKSIVGGFNWNRPVFFDFNAWRSKGEGDSNQQAAFRASVARGYDFFLERPIWISDVTGFNSIGMGNPYKRTCAICHSVHMTGADIAPGVMDLGVNTKPWADSGNKLDMSYLPVFKITCRKDVVPQPFAGRVIYTHDPGRALLTGSCFDVGALVMQQLRGMSARPPYFSNGSAKTIADVVDFYNSRFDMKITDLERQDLINFLSVL